MAGARSAGAARRCVVVGIGEPFRRDDGCGPRVVDALRGRVGPEVELVERLAQPMGLLDLWDGARLAVVVDAGRTGSAAGTVLRLEAEELRRLAPERTSSSHGLSVRDAYELGRTLGRLPERLVVYVIEAFRLGEGETLSPPVAEAVERTARAIALEVNGAVGRGSG